MLHLVLKCLREAAVALELSQWRVIIMICYRVARPGILTGILLSVARIAGETAPYYLPHYQTNLLLLIYECSDVELPVVIYQYAASPFDDWNKLAWAGAVITIFCFIFEYFNQILSTTTNINKEKQMNTS